MDKQVSSSASLKGTPDLPSDKSISHRAVMFASLHEGQSKITNFSQAADPQSTVECMRRLGVTVNRPDDYELDIQGVGRNGLRAPDKELDCGNSGTTMRLLSGIIAGSGVEARLTGDESLSARTMERIITPLRRMGAQITARKNDFAPLRIQRKKQLKALNFPLPIPSAQLKSCVLLAGLFGDEETKVIETLPSRDHSERLLELPIAHQGDKKTISSSRSNTIPEQSYRIPSDFSAAAFWLVAAAIHADAEIMLKGVGMNPSRTGALDVLKQMNADIEINNRGHEGAEPVADIVVRSSDLKPVEITEDIVPNCIDEIPILAIAMLFAEGTSRIRGAEELRHKETDRLQAVGEILQRTGAAFTEFEDGFEIEGQPDFVPDAATMSSYHDHRIAMSAAVLSLMAEDPSKITDAECTAISYPTFWDDLELLTY